MTDEQIVRTMLEVAGLEPPEDEIQGFVASYPMVKGMVDLIHGVEAARYESPALIFDPSPTFVDWS